MQAGGRRFDSVRLHHGLVLGMVLAWLLRESLGLGCVSGCDPRWRGRLVRGLICCLFFVSVKRLVRFCVRHDWVSDPMIVECGQERREKRVVCLG